MSRKDAVIDAVNTVDLLQSIYFDKEFEFKTAEDEANYQHLQSCIEQEDWTGNTTQLEFDIKAPIDLPENEREQGGYHLYLTFYCRLSTTSPTEYGLTIPSASNLWLAREDHEALVYAMTHEVDLPDQEERSTCIVEKMQQMQIIAEPYAMAWLKRKQEQTEKERAALATENGPVRFLRDWIWFPMIYTREKRGDIVKWAPKYGITGFLCPGKPGCMCLEGTEQKIAQFINDIKTISWADIPAGHKKMTSRWKQVVECQDKAGFESQRIFKDMQEVKFEIHGAFANHNNLSMLQTWLNERGCGEAFSHLFEYE
ncbi:hypothetical protein EDC96DRAFT_605634 [Choanephora cucurbitarum]|nr:hypothetical protein EDC96DRAFT_605634 [Choanephora cucurbitarum]